MARKIELKTITVALPNGSDEPPVFSYAAMMRLMLRFGPPAGLSFDEVVRAIEALRPVEEAIAAEAESVTLTEEQWLTLRQKLDKFPFAVADPVIVDFGMAIRNAPEIGTT